MMRMSVIRISMVLILAASTMPAAQGADGEKPEFHEVKVGCWLSAGPAIAPPAAFEKKAPRRAANRTLKESFLDLFELWPEAGDEVSWTTGKPLLFRTEGKPDSQFLDQVFDPMILDGSAGDLPQVAYLAGYLETVRRNSIKVSIESEHPFALYVNGEQEALQEQATGTAPSRRLETKLDLIAGKHCLTVKSVHHPESKSAWTISMRIHAPGRAGDPESPSWTVDPHRTFARIEDATRLENISSLSLSPDGRYLAVQRSRRNPESLTWIEVLNVSNGECEQVLRMGRSTNTPDWSPDGKELAFRSGDSLFAYRRGDGRIREILIDEKGLSSTFWAPDSSSIFFMTRGEDPVEGDYTRIYDPRDRLTDWDETVRLHVITGDGRSRRTLTATGAFAFTQAVVSPDGTKLALVRRLPVPERPFFESEFWLMDLSSGRTELVKRTLFPFENGPAHLTWSPEGTRIAFTAPPGETLAPGKGEEHNAFDTCLYVLDLESKAMTRISDRFGESVAGGRLWWRRADGKIYFIAQQRAFRRIARIDPSGTGGLDFLTRWPTVVSGMALAEEGGLLAYAGSSIDHPVRVLCTDLDDRTTRLLLDPNAEWMARMKLGAWERFDFINGSGDPMDGWIFTPPDFDANRSYPMIVYYYGGVSPREELFSVLTYHWFPANGYVVYVMNPSGAVGHTRAFADKHVNDWGALTVRDIADGVKRVLQKKPFIDASRIGCYGGSYGGFMTMSLLTDTNLFKAGVSLYGISNLASYWGAGIWGYTYGDTAMAGSYPWNSRGLFVDRSPLFKADRITAALLLLHGDSDVNVPPVESEQMFTALKVMGKDTAYVRFAGEDHGISGKVANRLAHRSMILEWFDKHLKGRPEGWERRWKKSSARENAQ